jgi:hypothetical protein
MGHTSPLGAGRYHKQTYLSLQFADGSRWICFVFGKVARYEVEMKRNVVETNCSFNSGRHIYGNWINKTGYQLKGLY